MKALMLVDPDTGIVRDAVDASTLLAAAGIEDVCDRHVIELAEFQQNATELKRITDEAQGIVSDELVRRLDQNGCWTLREGEFEIKTASPEAGTVAYDHDKLIAAVAQLLDADVISQTAADAALEPVKPAAQVPWPLVHEVVAVLHGERDFYEEEDLAHEFERLLDREPETTYRQRQAGINALLKLPAARDLVLACRVPVEPPRRKATVKRQAP